jgi:hypothetical protein
LLTLTLGWSVVRCRYAVEILYRHLYTSHRVLRSLFISYSIPLFALQHLACASCVKAPCDREECDERRWPERGCGCQRILVERRMPLTLRVQQVMLATITTTTVLRMATGTQLHVPSGGSVRPSVFSIRCIRKTTGAPVGLQGPALALRQ